MILAKVTEYLKSDDCKAWFRLFFLALMCALCFNVGQLVALSYVDVYPTHTTAQNITEAINETINDLWNK